MADTKKKFIIEVFDRRGQPNEHMYGVFESQKDADAWFDLHYGLRSYTREVYEIEIVRE